MVPDYIAMVRAALDIASARHICLLAVIGAVAMFGCAVWWPDPVRSWTVGGYAGVVLWPLVWAMVRKG